MKIYIDVPTGDELNENQVRDRSYRLRCRIMPLHELDNATALAELGVQIVDYIETPPPEIEPWPAAGAGPD